jgi:PhoH-like ATPase
VKQSEATKLFVLDTNVVLHDAKSILSFDEHDIALPITVLEEIDRFKRGKEDIHYQAREFLRTLDELTGDILSEQGASLGPGRGRIRIIWRCNVDQRLSDVFLVDSPDRRILATALHLHDTSPATNVVLVSKDTNIRMKAKALGVRAQDYISDKVESIEELYTGKRTVQLDDETLDRFYLNGKGVSAEGIADIVNPVANEHFVFQNGSKSVLSRYRAETHCFERIEKLRCYGITPRNAEQSFAFDALADPQIKLVSLAGKAGTGKTLLALAAALHCRSQYRQILLARPIVPLSNRDIGYLPGDVSAKLDPYMQPLYDNLGVIRHQFDENSPEVQRIGKMLELEKLVITPLAYIRGRTLQKTFFIIDESQNLTPHEIKTILTRAGEGSKIVLTGDIHQIDHPYLDASSNGLSYLINRMVGQRIYAHITLEKGERSELADLASVLL